MLGGGQGERDESSVSLKGLMGAGGLLGEKKRKEHSWLVYTSRVTQGNPQTQLQGPPSCRWLLSPRYVGLAATLRLRGWFWSSCWREASNTVISPTAGWPPVPDPCSVPGCRREETQRWL